MRRPAAKHPSMGEIEPHGEPRVTRQELREALNSGAAPRRRSTLLDAPPAWNWTTDEPDPAEIDALRSRAEELEAEVGRLRDALAAHDARERELRGALGALAAAPPWRRRGEVARLRGRGLV